MSLGFAVCAIGLWCFPPASRPSDDPAEVAGGPHLATPSSGVVMDVGATQRRLPVRRTWAGTTGEAVHPGPPWYRSGVMALGAVLGLLLLISYVARRYVPAVRALGCGVVKVIQRTPLSSKQSLALVEVGRRLVLVGIAPERISSLAVIDDAEECAHLLARVDRSAGSSGREFKTVLSAEAGKLEPACAGEVEARIRPSVLDEGRRADGSQRLVDTRGHLQGMLKKLKQMQK